MYELNNPSNFFLMILLCFFSFQDKQAVLQETICPGVIGGRLDFPRSASFAAMKLVLWWEEEYVAAYKKPSGFLQKGSDTSKDNQTPETEDSGKIVKDSDPSKFTSLISKSADQLLGENKSHSLILKNHHKNSFFFTIVCNLIVLVRVF